MKVKNNTKEVKKESMNKEIKRFKRQKMMFRITAVIAALLIIVGVAAYTINSNNKIFENYKNKYDNVVSENTELKQQIDKLKSEVTEKDSEIKTKSEVIEKIQNNYSTLSKQIDKLISAIQN